MRRNVRPWFHQDDLREQIYEVMTFTGTRFLNVYLAAPFCLLEMVACLKLYWSLYFHPHIICTAVLVYFTFISPPKRQKKEEKKEEKVE